MCPLAGLSVFLVCGERQTKFSRVFDARSKTCHSHGHTPQHCHMATGCYSFKRPGRSGRIPPEAGLWGRERRRRLWDRDRSRAAAPTAPAAAPAATSSGSPPCSASSSSRFSWMSTTWRQQGRSYRQRTCCLLLTACYLQLATYSLLHTTCCVLRAAFSP